MKHPFKKQGITNTLMNVGVGGAANVAYDYVMSLIPLETFASIGGVGRNLIKIGVGVLGGSMIGGNSTLAQAGRAAADGIAVVGVSNLVAGLINGEDENAGGSGSGSGSGSESGAAGLPYGTIGASGRYRMGQGKKFKRLTGVGGASFMQA